MEAFNMFDFRGKVYQELVSVLVGMELWSNGKSIFQHEYILLLNACYILYLTAFHIIFGSQIHGLIFKIMFEGS